MCQILCDFSAELLRVLAAMLEVVVASFGGDGEARRHRQTDARHLGQARPLPSENLFHGTGAVRFSCAEEIGVFHVSPQLLKMTRPRNATFNHYITSRPVDV